MRVESEAGGVTKPAEAFRVHDSLDGDDSSFENLSKGPSSQGLQSRTYFCNGSEGVEMNSGWHSCGYTLSRSRASENETIFDDEQAPSTFPFNDVR